MHRRLQMVSVLRICRNFLQTRATFGRAVPGSRENISTKSSGGRSANDCGWGSPLPARNEQFLLRTWLLPYSHASLGPAVATPLSGPPPLPTTSPCLWPTMRSSPSSSMSESLAWSSWLCRCLLLHRRDWPTPQSLAQTAIRSRQAGDITSQQNTAISESDWFPSYRCEHGQRHSLWRHNGARKRRSSPSSPPLYGVSVCLSDSSALVICIDVKKWFSALFSATANQRLKWLWNSRRIARI